MYVEPRPVGPSDHSSRKLVARRGVLWALRAALVASGVAFLVVGSALLKDRGSLAGESVQAPATERAMAVQEPAALPQPDLDELILLAVRDRWTPPAASEPASASVPPGGPEPEGAPVVGGPSDAVAPAPEPEAPPAAAAPPAPLAPSGIEAPSSPATGAPSAPGGPAPQPVGPEQVVPPPPPTPTAAAAAPVAAVAPVALTSQEAEFLAGLNAERVRAGLPPLELDPILVNAARYRSADMAARHYFSHTSPEGTTVFDLLDSWGFSYAWAGENLARNNYSDAEAVSVSLGELMASQPHRENILNPHYTRIGVGYANDGSGMHYLTTVFAG